MDKDTYDGLGKVIALLEQGWTKQVDARDANDYPVPYYDPTAVQFCVRGAARLVSDQMHTRPGALVVAASTAYHGQEPVTVNDHAHSVTEVIEPLKSYRRQYDFMFKDRTDVQVVTTAHDKELAC